MFQPVPSRVAFPELDRRILDYWQKNNTFERSVEQRREGPRFILYEGPPTANASPGIHHVLARVFKDLFPRYKAMKGYYAPRRAGWDTHGLPVELEVEKKLGLKSKREIESYGIAQFNAHCRENVMTYIHEWDKLTDRIGFWIDTRQAYVTFDNGYVETCWWIIKKLWDKGLIYQGYKVTPHCPRCVTSLSSHEVALGYKDNTVDPSVYVKFKLTEKSKKLLYTNLGLNDDVDVFFLAWTTTPWTLPGNTALAVAPDAEYIVVEYEVDERKERLILARALLSKALRAAHGIVSTVHGKNLVDLRYEPLYDAGKVPSNVMVFKKQSDSETKLDVVMASERPAVWEYPVIGTSFVSMEEGTGIVHIAPAFGEVDLEAGKQNELYFLQPVDVSGRMTIIIPWIADEDKNIAGRFVKKADPLVLEDLKSRDLLYRSEKIKHTYPFCWRCDTPLLYYAKDSWYVKTTAAKDRLISENARINWYPEHIKEGRFGDWLRNNVDWAISRERYWGTPLNVWQCEKCAHRECVGGLADLKSRPGLAGLVEPLDMHRPFVDQITFACPECSATMRRLPEVLDCWFDSGAMPFAQWHYPFEHQDIFKERFPADYICEAVDQTRGWFYSLHAISTLVQGERCYRNVICLGHILDARGEKMSKSKKNVVNPWEVLDKAGADAVRWYLYTSSPPGNVRRFSLELVEEALRKFLLTMWNTYSFFITYANIDKFDPATPAPAVEQRSELDRWIISELNRLTGEVTSSLDNYDPTRAGRRIEEFTENLSNWYVRRSRRRFWKSENDTDKLAAYATLYHCLVTLTRLAAPFTPFVAEELYQNLVKSWDKQAPDSVHLTDFPVADPGMVDEKLVAETQLVMRVVSLGRAARAKANIKVRQPLARIAVVLKSPAEKEALQRLESQVLEELNVKELDFSAESDLVQFEVSPNFALLGPKYGKELTLVAAAVKGLDPKEAAAAVAAGKETSASGYTLLPAEIVVNPQARPGYAVTVESGYVVGVSVEITPDLAEEGLSREIVHRLQTMRRNAGFDIADYIETYYRGDHTVEKVMDKFAAYVKQETLSHQLIAGIPPDGAFVERHKVEGKELTLGVRKVSR